MILRLKNQCAMYRVRPQSPMAPNKIMQNNMSMGKYAENALNMPIMSV